MSSTPVVIEIGESAFAVLAAGRELDLGTLESHAFALVKVRFEAAVVKRLGAKPPAKNQRRKTKDQLRGAALT
ncbi:MAG: hypothetical protein KJ042_05665 [Deltaproteobacteria bacterium]|nr:hypothetical protein [Deltaproteobacteria bacterium]